MKNNGEPKGANFLLTTISPSAIPEQTIVRSGEALQVKKADGVSYYKLKEFAKDMRIKPTPTEKYLHDFLIQNNIRHKWQSVVYPYIVDFIFLDKSLAIELDGQPHNAVNQMSYDTKRDMFLMDLGITMIRFPNDKILNNPELVLKLYQNRLDKNCQRFIAIHNNSYAQEDFGLSRFKNTFKRVFKKEFRKVICSHYGTYKPGMDWRGGQNEFLGTSNQNTCQLG